VDFVRITKPRFPQRRLGFFRMAGCHELDVMHFDILFTGVATQIKNVKIHSYTP